MIWFKRSIMLISAVITWAILTAVFISKDRVCNTLIDTLASKANISFCIDRKISNFSGCSLERFSLLYAHSPIAKIKKATVSPIKIEIEGVRLEGLANEFLPSKIDSIVFKPLSGKIYSEGDFGILKGDISWMERKISLELLPSSLMKREFRQTLKFFKMVKGKYRYDFSF